MTEPEMSSSLSVTSTMDAPMSSSLAITSAADVPMSASLGAMGPLLRKLDSLLPSDYRLPKLLKDRIELLKADLEDISVALVEQSMIGSPNEMARYWMNEVRDLSYEIEDFIDNMMSTYADANMKSVQSYKVGRVKIPWLPKTLKPCTRAAKVTELRTLVREASERYHRYLDGSTSSSRRVFAGYGRIPALYAHAASNLVGVDDSKAKLIKCLTDEEDKQLKVVAIVGPAGVGKTTLAKQVYHEIEEQFECQAFVRASRKPDMRRLLGGILSQVQGCPRPPDSRTVQNLIDNLTKHLQDKRYVIVIDDLWETIAWDVVASAFPEGNNRSIIITTAEDEGVALELCNYQSNNILKMNLLGREDSEILFFNTVFGPGNPCPEQLKEVSDIIITTCAGLPLATVCVAGLLASQPDSSELWQHVQECLSSNLNTNSSLEDILHVILKSSYYTLPHHLKTCLKYLSMYPEGHTLWKVDLVKQWISEGFISSPEGKEREEVAQSYFRELVNRRMILPVDTNNNDEILSCKLHHTVLDLITLESNEENFVTALDYSQTITGLYCKARRLSLHFSNTRYATKPAGLTLPQVRSLAFFGILQCMPSIVEFKLLRVLILEFWGDHQGSTSLNLKKICRLFQLKYLKISCDASVEVELPTHVRMLRYLETLIIDAVVSAVPLDIIHLPGLWHLSLGDKIDLPDEIGHIRSLRTLHYFDVGSNSEDNILSLGDLMNLQDIHLTYYKESNEHLKRNLRALSSSLAKLVNLKSITLAPGASDTTIYLDVRSSMSSPPVFLQRLELLPPVCIFSRLPEWIGQLQKLIILKVVVSELLMKDMDMLIGLPALTILALYVRQPTAESIIFKRGALVRLKYFKYTCGVLPLTFQKEALPNLQRLELSFNAHRGVQYDDFLPGMDYLLNLKEIVGTIGAADGAEERDRLAAESAFKKSIRKHPRFHSYDNVKRVDRVCEEYQLGTQEEVSSSEKHEILQKEHKRKEGDSSGDQFRILPKETDEDTKQHSDQISQLSATGSVITFDQMETDSVSAHTEQSFPTPAPEEINSHGGSTISRETGGSTLEELWVHLPESSMNKDTSYGGPRKKYKTGGSVAFSQQIEYGPEDSGRNINTANNVPANHVGAVKLQGDQPQYLQTPDLDSLSKQFLSFPWKTPVDGNIPNDVPARENSLGLWKYLNYDSACLGGNIVSNEKHFNITDFSPEWACSTEHTKILVVGQYYEQYMHLAGSNMYGIFGDNCVAANMVQTGVYRFMVGPHIPRRVDFYLTLDGKTPITEVLSFEYRSMHGSSLQSALKPLGDEYTKSKLQMQMRLARLLFVTNKKNIAPQLPVEGNKLSNLISASPEKEWMDLWKTASNSQGARVPATDGLLELVLWNKLQEWILERVIGGHKSTGRDDLGQGPIHLCSFLGYTWAIRLFSVSGFSLDFRDSSGWTALHWAAYHGRERIVAALLSAGANPSLVTDPTAASPGGCTPADVAARQGYVGLAAYLAEKGLTAHFESMSLSKDTEQSPSKTKLTEVESEKFENLTEQEICLKESLAAYRNAADAASNIQAALRDRTLKLQTKATLLASSEIQAAAIVAAIRIQHAFRNYKNKKEMRTAARMKNHFPPSKKEKKKNHFPTRKVRRNYTNMRRQAIRIQAVYRGHQVIRQYRKVIWSVGVMEKAILRWRKKRKGLRGIGNGMPVEMTLDVEPASTAEEDFFRASRQQAEDRFSRSVVRVQALFRSHRAQHEYRRMRIAHDEAKLEFSEEQKQGPGRS